ncbi:MAG: cbb3-type cytochrome oxidase assembly protein CcoS [Spirochaetales bacterium]|nr:cbb3-type cytochrome oxidase assembly protein CcoS [Spirochaetales bacterium]
MPGLAITLPVSLIIALIFLGFFLWSVKNGDFEDSEVTGEKILFDEDEADKNGPGAL